MVIEYYDYGPTECSTSESIAGGKVEYSDGGNDQSVLTYTCPPGYEPYPVASRHCSDGEWSRMTSATGIAVDLAECRSNLGVGSGE